MKTRINQVAIALFFAFILVAGTVNAKGNEAKASSHENVVESALELEHWMMDCKVWNTETCIWLEVQEENIVLENWMTDENTWEVNTILAETEQEQDLAIENWMINENVWNR